MGGPIGEQTLTFILRVVPPAFALLALAQTVQDWRSDLVERRRRLRLFVVLATAAYIVVVAAVELSLGEHRAPAPLEALNAAGLAAMAALIAVLYLRA